MARSRKGIPSNVRRQVFERDRDACRKCGRLHDLCVHHILAVSDGGDDSPANLIVLCAACHAEWHAFEMRSKYTFDDWLDFPNLNFLMIAFRIRVRDDMSAHLFREQVLKINRSMREDRDYWELFHYGDSEDI